MSIRAFDFWSGAACGALANAGLVLMPGDLGLGLFFVACAIGAFAISFWRFEIFKQ